tara:strand:+ start:1260 stop:1526 length:267 start_codon:yes stop_codon:yes gene_type:complete
VEELPPVLAPPPVRNLWCIYGVNLDTEVSYYYKASARGEKKGKLRLLLDTSADRHSGKKEAMINPRYANMRNCPFWSFPIIYYALISL